jgi:hypothetical protein
VYIADGDSFVEQVTPGETLSILAGTHTFALPSYGGPASGSPLDDPSAVAVSPAGAVYVADLVDGAIERIAAAAPVNSAAPVISGTASEGQVLTASSGSWTNSPDSLLDQWQDCDASGDSCTAIPHSTSSTYTMSSGDVGHTIRVAVTATNAGGQATQLSQATGVVAAPAGPIGAASVPTAPVSTVVPSIAGTAAVGQQLSCAVGTWADDPISYAYQWDRDGAAINGATAAGHSHPRCAPGCEAESSSPSPPTPSTASTTSDPAHDSPRRPSG